VALQQAVLANMRGAGEPVFECDSPSSDMMGEIMSYSAVLQCSGCFLSHPFLAFRGRWSFGCMAIELN
jgi:hypothetical protein